MTGISLKDLSLGKQVSNWRECVVSENDLQQSGEIDRFKPTMEGRMLRTDQYKYCIYSKGNQRESLIDMQNDPGETHNLTTDPAYKSVLMQMPELLREYGKENNDLLVDKLLENNVQPIPFVASDN